MFKLSSIHKTNYPAFYSICTFSVIVFFYHDDFISSMKRMHAIGLHALPL